MKRKKKLLTPEERAAQTLKNKALAAKRKAKLAQAKELQEHQRLKRHITRMALRAEDQAKRRALREEEMKQRSARYQEMLAKQAAQVQPAPVGEPANA